MRGLVIDIVMVPRIREEAEPNLLPLMGAVRWRPPQAGVLPGALPLIFQYNVSTLGTVIGNIQSPSCSVLGVLAASLHLTFNLSLVLSSHDNL